MRVALARGPQASAKADLQFRKLLAAQAKKRRAPAGCERPPLTLCLPESVSPAVAHVDYPTKRETWFQVVFDREPAGSPKAAARRRRSETRTRTLLDRPFALAPSRCAGNVGTRPGDSLQLFIHFHCSCEFATNLRNQPARCEKRSRCALKIQYSHRQRTHAIHSRECEKTFE